MVAFVLRDVWVYFGCRVLCSISAGVLCVFFGVSSF